MVVCEKESLELWAREFNQNGRGYKKPWLKFILTPEYHGIFMKHLFLDSNP